MVVSAAFLAVDWGTTNRRVYALDNAGDVLATERDDRGILAVGRGGFAAEAAAIRDRFGDLPMLCAGMVGSVNGWAEAAYRPCPAGLDDLAAALTSLVSDPSRASAWGAAARRRVEEHFSWEAIGERTLAVYRSVLERR